MLVTVHGYVGHSPILYSAALAGPLLRGKNGSQFTTPDQAIISKNSWILGGKQVNGLSGSPVVGPCGYNGMVHAVVGFPAGWTNESYAVIITPAQIRECLKLYPHAGAICPGAETSFLPTCGRRLSQDCVSIYSFSILLFTTYSST